MGFAGLVLTRAQDNQADCSHNVFDIKLQRLLWTCCPGRTGVWGSDREDDKATVKKWPASRTIRSVEELETLPTGTKPKTLNHRSPGRERSRQEKRSTVFIESM